MSGCSQLREFRRGLQYSKLTIQLQSEKASRRSGHCRESGANDDMVAPFGCGAKCDGELER